MVKLNPSHIKREINRAQNELYNFNILKQNIDKKSIEVKKLRIFSITFLFEASSMVSSTFLCETTEL